MSLLAVDCETTGVDHHHGARPFFVTSCRDDGTQVWWEWDVDPLTRQPAVPAEDLEEIRGLLGSPALVLQNARFDAAALATVGVGPWPWERTEDTLLAGHLLASNQRHDLTGMVVHYLGRDISPYEDALEVAVKEARKLVRREYPDWSLASSDRPDMPSCPKSSTGKAARGDDKDAGWKYDSWLPHAVALENGYPDDHPWWSVLRDYANTDSAATFALWRVMERELRRRKLWAIYRERRKLLPVVAAMEVGGVAVHRGRLEGLASQLREASDEAAAKCRTVAEGYSHRVPCPRMGLKTHDRKPCERCGGAGEVDFELGLPAGGANGSLRTFMIDVMGLEVVRTAKQKTDAASLGKEAIRYYLDTLPPRSRELAFVRALEAKRVSDTGLSYLDGYRRFWLPVADGGDASRSDWYVLYPRLNPTGTDTLRFSSSNPNSQNIKKGEEGEGLRSVFGPPPGYEWWSLDAQNIELRLPAYKSGEREQVALFEEPDRPPYYGSVHLLNFSTVYPDLWERELREVGLEKVGPHCKKKYAATWYQWVKNGDFAIQYGAGTVTADRTFRRPGAHALLKSRFKALDRLNQETIRFAERHGYVETWPDKTVDPDRGYPLMTQRTDRGGVLPTVPLSYKVQGSAMQWTCKGMVRCHEVLEEWRREAIRRLPAAGYRIVMQVHDELVFEMPRRADPRVDPRRSNLGRARELARLMAMGGDDVGVPTPVGIEYHPEHWGAGVTFRA